MSHHHAPIHVRAAALAAAATALIFAGCQAAAERSSGNAADGAGQVQVNFEQPEHFTDVRERFGAGPSTGYLDGLRRFLQREAARHLEPDETLVVTFYDVDLAGDFEPWRGVNAQDVRIVKDIYPPRLQFNYVVSDADGNIQHEGTERLTDLSASWRLRIPGTQDDPLQHEKQLLRDWMRRTLDRN